MKNKRLSLQWLFNAVIGKVGIYSPDFVGRLLVNIPLEYSYGKAYGNFEKK